MRPYDDMQLNHLRALPKIELPKCSGDTHCTISNAILLYIRSLFKVITQFIDQNNINNIHDIMFDLVLYIYTIHMFVLLMIYMCVLHIINN